MSKYNTKVQRGEYSLDGAESTRFLVLFLTVWLAVRCRVELGGARRSAV